MKNLLIKTKTDADSELLLKFLERTNMVDKITTLDEKELKLFSSEEVFDDLRNSIKKEFKKQKQVAK